MKTSLEPPSLSLPISGARSPGRRQLLSKLARAGIASRGVLYGVVGALSVGLASGAGGKTTSQTGALKTIAHQPLGTVALFALAIGLAGYSAWRLVEGVSGFGGDGDDKASAGHRASAIASGVAYAVLCGAAVEILVGSSPSGGGAKQATAGVLGWPGGPVYVAIAGVVLLGAGAYQGYKGIAQKFCEDSRTERMSPETRRTFIVLGVAGHCARGVTFLLIAYGLIKAAVDYSPQSAVGLDGALQKLIHAPYGPLLLGIVAAGFIAYALFSIMDARYHKV